MSIRVRSSALVLAAATLVVAMGACTGSGFHPVDAVTPAKGTTSGGDAVAPDIGVPGGKTYLFRSDKPPVKVQSGSVTLANMTAKIPSMVTTGLASTQGATAVMLVERATDQAVWGTQLLKAENDVFRTFAATSSMGDWLVMVTDVDVTNGQDPVFPTGYRWTRAMVDQYVKCGIPASGSNDCKSAFFRLAQSVVLAPQGGAPRGQ
jgi:hypothetical protein